MEDKQKLAVDVTKALGYTENGGKPDINNTKAGKTGELKSIFQITPATWKNYSKQVFGKEVPLTPDNESHVVLHKVNDWLNKGYHPDQIASMWNAGVGEPDAYNGKFTDGTSSKGINKKYGVQYDVPGYVKKFNSFLSGFTNNQQTPASEPSSEPAVAPAGGDSEPLYKNDTAAPKVPSGLYKKSQTQKASVGNGLMSQING